MPEPTEPKNADCMQCKHFFVTWEPQNPRACRAFGFKGKEIPSVVVKRESGQDCQMFEAK